MINRTQEEIIQKWPKEWEEPTVSVRCITYNHEPYIAQALDSFLMQETTFPFEIIVHDDASTDKTADIIREYEAKFPQIIKPIYETENQYSKKDGTLLRIMTSACKGKYIAFCDGDDFWCDRHKLQKQYEIMETHPECSLCTHIVQVIAENGSYLKKQIPKKNFIAEGLIEKGFLIQTLLAEHKHPFQTSSYFLKNSLIKENYSFFNSPGAGDQKILRIALNEGKFYFIPSIMSCYRNQSIGSWSSKIYKNKDTLKKARLIAIDQNICFDEYTQYKYHKFIETGNKTLQIQIAIADRDFKTIFLPDNIEIAKKSIPLRRLKLYFILSKLPLSFSNLFFTVQSCCNKAIKFFITIKKRFLF